MMIDTENQYTLSESTFYILMIDEHQHLTTSVLHDVSMDPICHQELKIS